MPQPVEVIEDRAERFEEMGFTQREARLLSAATELSSIKNRRGEIVTFESPLQPIRVRKALEGGCNHVMALKLFT